MCIMKVARQDITQKISMPGLPLTIKPVVRNIPEHRFAEQVFPTLGLFPNEASQCDPFLIGWERNLSFRLPDTIFGAIQGQQSG